MKCSEDVTLKQKEMYANQMDWKCWRLYKLSMKCKLWHTHWT